MAAAVAAVFVALTASADLLGNYVAAFNATDDERYANAYPNARAESFLRGNIPLLECPDKDIERTYYFRWWTYRKHVRATADGKGAARTFSTCCRRGQTALTTS